MNNFIEIQKEEYQKIVDLHYNVMSCNKIAQLYNVANHVIRYIIKVRMGQKIRPISETCKNSKNYIEMGRLYSSGLSTVEIGKLLNASYTTVNTAVKAQGLKIRTNSENNRIYTLNENYFENIDSSDKAYFLGLLYADGSVSQFKNSCILSLTEIKPTIFEVFKRYLECDKPLYLKGSKLQKDGYVSKPYYSLEINSEKLSQDLINQGCHPNKTIILDFPNEKMVPKKLLWHFLRGFFDGDGCIGLYGRNIRLNITGTKSMLYSIKNFLIEFDIFCNVGKYKNKNAYQLQANNKNALKFFRLIYEDCNELKLERKYKKYQEVEEFIQSIKINV